MSKVVLDRETLAKLNDLTQQLELYDQQGNLLGYCTPVESHLYGVDLPGPDPFSDEQIAETLKTIDAGRPLADILRDLRNR
jgi:hypothetical protein